MTDKDELAALRERIEQLERANKPPEPFKPTPCQRYDPTANMSMPRSTMLDMVAAVPDMREIALRDARAPPGPSSAGAIPSSQQVSGGGGATSWPALHQSAAQRARCEGSA